MMNDTQICFEYGRLLSDGKVRPLFDCIGRDSMMHPFYNAEKDEVYFQCLSCNFKMTPGINIIKKMRRAILNSYNEEQSNDQ